MTTAMARHSAHPWIAEADSRVRFGIFGGPGDAWVREVERLGFDSFWVGDHPAGLSGDCWTRLAVFAGLTERIRLGPLVSCVYYRPPFLLARVAADVDQLSGGRLVLGLGTGDHPREFQQLGLGDPPLRARHAALVETAQFVRALWRGETITMHGSYVHAEGAKLPSLPVQQPYVPMLIAGGGEQRTLLHVAEHADACNFGPSSGTGSAWTDVDVKRKLEALRGHCATVGRPYNSVLRSHFTFPLISAETEAALDAKLAGRGDAAQLAEAQREPGLPRLVTAHLDFGVDIPYVIVAGTPPQLITYYGRLVEAGMRYFIVSCGSDMETLRILAQDVMPQVALTNSQRPRDRRLRVESS